MFKGDQVVVPPPVSDTAQASVQRIMEEVGRWAFMTIESKVAVHKN